MCNGGIHNCRPACSWIGLSSTKKMKTIDLKTVKRQETGKKATKQLRKQGLIPCVLYGVSEPIHFSAETNAFRHLVYTPHAYIIKLSIDEQEYLAVMKEIQFHPVSDKILHVDFLEVSDKKPVEIGIPVDIEGFSMGVQDGGKLKVEMRRLKVSGLFGDLPDTLTIDVSDIGLGESIKVRDLSFENLDLVDPGSAVVISVKLTRVAKGMALDVEEEAVEEEEGEEGEEGETTDSGDTKEASAE